MLALTAPKASDPAPRGLRVSLKFIAKRAQQPLFFSQNKPCLKGPKQQRDKHDGHWNIPPHDKPDQQKHIPQIDRVARVFENAGLNEVACLKVWDLMSASPCAIPLSKNGTDGVKPLNP